MLPNTSLELTMAAGGSGARRSGRWMLRAGSSARCRYAAARRRKTTCLVLLSKGELACPGMPRRLVMAPRLRRSLFAMHLRPWVSEVRGSLAGSRSGRRLAERAGAGGGERRGGGICRWWAWQGSA